jgi:glycosyltransferase involved in cell wall biosynthesis
MKVIHIETGRHLYGGSLQVHYLIDGLNQNNVESVLICEQSSPLGQKVDSNKVKVYKESIKGDVDFAFLKRLKQIFRQEKPDLIHLHSRRGCDVLGGLAAKSCGVPVVLSRRVDNPEARIVAALKYRLYSHIITISEGIRCVLASEGVPLDKISCVPSAVNIEQYHQERDRAWFEQTFAIQQDQIVIGVVAQLISRKGHRYLLDVLPTLLQTYPHIRVIFFGKGPAEQQLRDQIEALGLQGVVKLAGFRDDMPRVLPNLDLLVHPAEMEGLGVSLLQAAVAGVPIIASNAGGMPEIVRHGMTGLLVPPKSRELLQQAIEHMLANPEQAKQMAVSAKKLVEVAFSIPAMVQGNLSVYRQILAAN